MAQVARGFTLGIGGGTVVLRFLTGSWIYALVGVAGAIFLMPVTRVGEASTAG